MSKNERTVGQLLGDLFAKVGIKPSVVEGEENTISSKDLQALTEKVEEAATALESATSKVIELEGKITEKDAKITELTGQLASSRGVKPGVNVAKTPDKEVESNGKVTIKDDDFFLAAGADDNDRAVSASEKASDLIHKFQNTSL